jgi:hypothetical protein
MVKTEVKGRVNEKKKDWLGKLKGRKYHFTFQEAL